MDFQTHLKSYLNNEEIELLMDSLKKPAAHGLLLNIDKMDEKIFLKKFPNIIRHPIVKNGYIFDKSIYPFGQYFYHEMGVYYLQEPSAMIVSYLLNPQNDETILDMCAAPGGKTIQCSLLMKQTGVVYANDISYSRCLTLLENVERMGLGNILITNNDWSKIYQKYLNYFDKIILDAPCSGSGMFRKDNKFVSDWTYSKVLKYADEQKRLINIAYQMLKPGGELIYSTCSFSMEEDEEVVLSLLNDFDDAQIIDISNQSPLFYVNKKKPIGVHLFPYIFDGEGHYICKIKKSSSIANNPKISQLEERWFGNFLFTLPKKIKIDQLNIIRFGLKKYEKRGQDLIPCYHFSHHQSAKSFIPNCIDINIIDTRAYVKGETVATNIEPGWYLLSYENIPFSFAKSDGKLLKNHYPKYLRQKKFII